MDHAAFPLLVYDKQRRKEDRKGGKEKKNKLATLMRKLSIKPSAQNVIVTGHSCPLQVSEKREYIALLTTSHEHHIPGRNCAGLAPSPNPKKPRS